jgi:hypothetical protein
MDVTLGQDDDDDMVEVEEEQGENDTKIFLLSP